MPSNQTIAEVLAAFRAVHGAYYDYTKVVYVKRGHDDYRAVPRARGVYHHAGVSSPGGRVPQLFRRLPDPGQRGFCGAGPAAVWRSVYEYGALEVPPPAGATVQIACRVHHTVFAQEPQSHLRGHTACPGCQGHQRTRPQEARGTLPSTATPQQAFIDRARQRHGQVYDYTAFTYKGMGVPGKIRCPHHGPFWQTPKNHLHRHPCPDCPPAGRPREPF